MTHKCLGCTCTSAHASEKSGHLVLATRVDHTATTLHGLAQRTGVSLRALAPGLLTVEGTDHHRFLTDARQELTSVEAEEVRCLVTPDLAPGDMSVLAAAMTAPSLAVAGARIAHADLLPLFEDERGCFYSEYQPIVSLPQRATIGYEALLRAQTPDGRKVTPNVLFPAAEAAGWTHVLDRVGRTTALRDAGSWLGDALLFVNFIPTSIYRPEVCLRTTELAAHKAGVRLSQVVFEVTESHQVTDPRHLSRVFDYYRSRRSMVALDDLGAGYSSLNLLVHLQPDIVKLDKEVTQALPGRVAGAVVTAIAEITHAYGGRVLAECVETEAQATAAVELGVDLGQGWLFGRPERRGGRRLVTDTSGSGVPSAPAPIRGDTRPSTRHPVQAPLGA